MVKKITKIGWKIVKKDEQIQVLVTGAQISFIILVLLGLLLNNEIILMIGVLFLLVYPGLAVYYLIVGIVQSIKKRNRRRKKARADAERLLQCPVCEKVYRRDELDQSPSVEPFCPDCESQLVNQQ
jgi:hypothetical protein